MSCCGRGTRTPGGMLRDSSRPLPGRHLAHDPGRQAQAVYFQYAGTSNLTARGPVSGRSYRFDAPGAVLPVDPRDWRSLEAVPTLRRVAGPLAPRA